MVGPVGGKGDLPTLEKLSFDARKKNLQKKRNYADLPVKYELDYG